MRYIDIYGSIFNQSKWLTNLYVLLDLGPLTGELLSVHRGPFQRAEGGGLCALRITQESLELRPHAARIATGQKLPKRFALFRDPLRVGQLAVPAPDKISVDSIDRQSDWILRPPLHDNGGYCTG